MIHSFNEKTVFACLALSIEYFEDFLMDKALNFIQFQILKIFPRMHREEKMKQYRYGMSLVVELKQWKRVVTQTPSIEEAMKAAIRQHIGLK